MEASSVAQAVMEANKQAAPWTTWWLIDVCESVRVRERECVCIIKYISFNDRMLAEPQRRFVNTWDVHAAWHWVMTHPLNDHVWDVSGRRHAGQQSSSIIHAVRPRACAVGMPPVALQRCRRSRQLPTKHTRKCRKNNMCSLYANQQRTWRFRW